jgi:hypothetical protein
MPCLAPPYEKKIARVLEALSGRAAGRIGGERRKAAKHSFEL